ncbi:MAG TPA: ATP-binding cassette domain-containing protein [Streptosporangiaceae bacterium]|nr:ATP-binding cassette domain-containing protein [Streptosporangiaceae bacterium]
MSAEAVSTAGAPARLAAVGLAKEYGHVRALEEVSVEFKPGLTGIVGDNGAGKSTLMRILSGVEVADEGSVLVDGQPCAFESARDARMAGIESLYQDLALVDTMSVADNIFLGREITHRVLGTRIVDRRRMRQEADRVLGTVRINMPSSRAGVRQLSGGQRQAVAIARALHFKARVLLLDEPTAALGPRETAAFLGLIRHVADRGETVVMVGHNLPQMLELADHLLVMRAGRVRATLNPKETSLRDLAELMVGSA